MTPYEYSRAVLAVEDAQRVLDSCLECRASKSELDAAQNRLYQAETSLDELVTSASVKEREAIWIGTEVTNS